MQGPAFSQRISRKLVLSKTVENNTPVATGSGTADYATIIDTQILTGRRRLGSITLIRLVLHNFDRAGKSNLTAS